MLEKLRRFTRRLHKDESGPNTVEWILLIIVALLVLVAIYVFVNKVVLKNLDEATDEFEKQEIDSGN
jgi:Flp pilus assembly pilin Flp